MRDGGGGMFFASRRIMPHRHRLLARPRALLSCSVAIALGVACTSEGAGPSQGNDGGVSDGSSTRPDTPGGLTRRSADPVVLSGGQVPGIVGSTPQDVVAFVRKSGAWSAIPVQVDERFRGDFCTVYAKAKLGDGAPCKTPLSIETIFYADEKTYTGSDPDPQFDRDDELVFMARHAGDRWGHAGGEPSGVRANTAVEVEIADGDEHGFVYLFIRADQTLDASAKQDLISYKQAFKGGPSAFDYKKDYPFVGLPSCGYAPNTTPIPCDPPILEDSIVKSANYERHFSARWVTDGLKITLGTSDGANILDLAQARFAPNICGRTVSTFSTSEGAFVANIDGPVRAIRSYLGANSGPLTQRTHIFYDRMEITHTMLRVHAIGSIMDLVDYATAATGMTYYNSQNKAGVPIDGKPDSVNTEVPSWELVSGPHGSVMHTLTVRSSLTLTNQGYYLDDNAADGANDQCELSSKLSSPDKVAFGQSGLRIMEGLADTDPRNGSKNHVFFERTSYYEEPTFGVSDAEARMARSPIKALVRNSGSTDACGDGVCGPTEAATCPHDCSPYDGRCGDGACNPWEDSVNCSADCRTGTSPVNSCGDGTCGVGEQKLNCAKDCWTPKYDPFSTCLKSRCAETYGACGDELACVEFVACVAECVDTGGAIEGCKTSCAGKVATTAEQRAYADALLACAGTKRCAP